MYPVHSLSEHRQRLGKLFVFFLIYPLLSQAYSSSFHPAFQSSGIKRVSPSASHHHKLKQLRYFISLLVLLTFAAIKQRCVVVAVSSISLYRLTGTTSLIFWLSEKLTQLLQKAAETSLSCLEEMYLCSLLCFLYCLPSYFVFFRWFWCRLLCVGCSGIVLIWTISPVLFMPKFV